MSDCRQQFNLSLHACKGRVKKLAFLENPHLLFHPPRGGQRSERAEEPIVVIREHCQSADNHGLARVSARHLIQSRARGSRAHNVWHLYKQPALLFSIQAVWDFLSDEFMCHLGCYTVSFIIHHICNRCYLHLRMPGSLCLINRS